MRFDLTTPCTNCPFRNDETRITFRGRERAREIEEQAYRQGFPCHASAVVRENPITGDEEFIEGERTQHCAGYILMQLHEGYGSPWPGIDNDDELLDRLTETMDWKAPVFENSEAFFEANADPDYDDTDTGDGSDKP